MGRMRRILGWGLVGVAVLLVGTGSYAATEKRSSPSPLQLPTCQKKTHLMNNLWLTVSNYGFYGSAGDYTYYSCVFPAGSDMDYLFWGGLWLGALVGNDTLVSCGVEGWAGPQHELYPTDDPGDTIIERSICPSSPYYDTLAISEQDFVCAYSDTYTDTALVGPDHHPLGLKVYQNSYAFTHPVAEDFIFFDFKIANIGTLFIRDLYMGLYLDGDCGPFGPQYGHDKAEDDVTGFRPWSVLTPDTTWNPKLRISTAWTANACRLGLVGNCQGIPTPDVTGTRVLISPNPQYRLSYNWWVVDVGMQYPVTDPEKWLLMSNGEIDPDQTVNPPPGHPDTVYDDTRYVLSFGPIFTAPDSSFPPGDSARLILACTGGENFQIYDYPPDSGTPSEDWYDFADLALNSQWAMDVCDNPGVDTDPADTLYPWYVINPGTGDTIWMGDGVADFRIPRELPPGPPKDLTIAAFTDTSVYLAWRMNCEYDLKGYNIYRSTTSGTLYTQINTSILWDTTFVDTTVAAGTRYYWVTTCIDSLDLESEYSNEVTILVGQPSPPDSLTATSGNNRYIDLNWRPPEDPDILAYNLYRSTISGSLYVRIDSLVPDTSYRDTNLTNGVIYYYVVSAVDSTYLESEYSDEAWGVPMGFDSGVLLVDETYNGPGLPFFPDDAQVDSLYHRMLEGCQYTDWENSDGSNPPSLVDLAPYSTVVWHSDEPTAYPHISEDTTFLRTYLYAGGRLWLVGLRNLLDLSGFLPKVYEEGEFPYDYLHLSEADHQMEYDFIGATGLLDYPSLEVDSTRVLPTWEGKLPYVEILVPRDGEAVYTFNSASGDTHYQDHPCGIRYLGTDHRVVFFGFPLWQMGEEEAILAGRKALRDLGEPVGVEELSDYQLAISTFQLHQNYPNPCRQFTIINYQLPKPSHTSLRVYDLTGRVVRTLVDDKQKPGFYKVIWDGRDNLERRTASGIYFYGLKAGEFTSTKKMILLK